jgi:hypothetical protein
MPIYAFSSLIMIIVTLVTFGIAFIPSHSSGLESKFIEGYNRIYGSYDSFYQRAGHEAGLIIMLVLVLAVIIIKHRQIRIPGILPALIKNTKLYAGGLLLLVSVLAAIINYGGQSWLWSLLRLAVLPLFLVILAVQAKQIIPRIYIRGASWMGNFAYLLALTVPAFLTFIWTLKVQPGELAAVQQHYVLLLSFADRLAINAKYFSQWLPNYGLVLSSLLGAYQQHFGLLDFGQHIRIVQALQGIFLLAAFLALYRWQPRRPLYILFALMFFGIYAGTANNSIFYPNQSGWRFLGFPLWLLILTLAKDRPIRQAAYILGFSSGLFLLFNLETGIVIAGGSIIFLFSRLSTDLRRRMISSIIRFTAGAVAAVVIFGVLFYLKFGRFPFSVYLGKNYEYIRLCLSGFNGHPLKFDLLAIFIFMHCVYIAASGILTWSTREISPRASIKLAVASAILVWFAYYMNRADTWNLWTICFLYSFLLLDFLDTRLIAFLWRKRGVRALMDLRVGALVWVLLPVILLNTRMLVPNFVVNKLRGQSRSWQAPTGQGLAVISGVRLPLDIAAVMEQRAALVKKICNRDKTIYLTRDALLIPLMTRQFNPLSVQDVYLESFEPTRQEQLIREILVNNPKYILVDDPASILSATDFAAKSRQEFYGRIMNSLSDNYRRDREESDWIIWERK